MESSKFSSLFHITTAERQFINDHDHQTLKTEHDTNNINILVTN